MMAGERISIRKAALINGTLKYIAAFFNIGFSIILARILEPEIYGTVAVTMVFVNFFMSMSAAGLGTAIIQYKELNISDMDSIFTISIYIAFAMSIFTVLLGFPIALLYKNEIYKKLFVYLSVGVFFYMANAVPSSLLMRKKEFVKAGMRIIVATVLSYVTAIIMAVLNMGYYALIAQTVSYAAITFLWNFWNSGLKLQKKVDFSVIRIVKSYSLYQDAFNFVNYFSRNLDNLLIGKFFGEYNLAFYEKSYVLMMYPVQGITNVITPVLHPIMSEYQNKREKIYKQYVKLIKFLSLSGCLISIYVLWNAGEIVLFLLGENWKGAVPCMRILGISIWAQMIISATGAIYQSIGNKKLLLISGISGALLTITGMLVGLVNGKMESVALGVTIAYMLNVFLTHWIMIKKGLHKKLFPFMKEILPDFIWMFFLILLFLCAGIKIRAGICVLIIKTLVLMLFYGIYIIITKRYQIFRRIKEEK